MVHPSRSATLVAAICLLVLSNGQLQAAAPNDRFADRLTLGGTSITVEGTNVGATAESGEPNHAADHGYISAGKSVWHSWRTAVGGHVEVTLTGNFNKVIAIYTGTSVDALTRVGSAFNNGPYAARTEFVAIPDTEYLIAVDGYGSGSGSFTLSIEQTPPPPNDRFSHPIEIVGTDTTMTGSNVSASKEPGEPSHAGVAGGQSVWWTWTAPAFGWVTVTASGSFSKLLAVYTGQSVDALTEVASHRPGSSYNSATVSFEALAGTAYRIAVDGDDDYTDSVEVRVFLRPPPANDSFASSTALAGTSVDLYEAANLSATKEPGEPDHAGNPGGHSVWWVWTAPVTGRFAVFTDTWMGSLAPLDRVLGIYTGAAVSALTEVASAAGRSNTIAKANFDAVQGTVYHFAVDGQDGVSGAFNFYLRQPPANDDFADRSLVTNTNVAIPGTNANATSEPGEPIHASYGNTPPTSVWWRWTAPVSGRAVVSATSSDSQNLGVYTGTTVADLEAVALGTANSVAPGYATFDATEGTEYQIAVDGGSSGGTFSLQVQYVTPPENDLWSERLTVTNTPAPGSFFVTGSNHGATKEPGETSLGTASVWWTWTAPTHGEVLIELETYGTTMTYPWLNLYSGDTLSNLDRVTPRAEWAANKSYHDARFSVTAGTTYSIWVANRGGKQGTYTLRGTFKTRPENDDFANRTPLDNTPFLFQYGYQRVNAHNLMATREPGEPWHGGADYRIGNKSVWWTWTAPHSGRASVGISPIRYVYSSIVGVYTGTQLASLTQVAHAYSTCTAGSSGVEFPVTAGTTYQIAADGGGGYGDSGDFDLSLDVQFDTNAPSVTMVSPLAGEVPEARINAGGTAQDLAGTGAFRLASGVSLVEVRLNGGPWQPAAGTANWSLELTVAPGANLIEARARDAVGNTSDIAAVTVTHGALLTGFRMDGGQLQVTFPSALGKSYQIEWTPSLTPPVFWNPVPGDPVAGTGLPLTLAVTGAPQGPHRFYRLVVRRD